MNTSTAIVEAILKLATPAEIAAFAEGFRLGASQEPVAATPKAKKSHRAYPRTPGLPNAVRKVLSRADGPLSGADATKRVSDITGLGGVPWKVFQSRVTSNLCSFAMRGIATRTHDGKNYVYAAVRKSEPVLNGQHA